MVGVTSGCGHLRGWLDQPTAQANQAAQIVWLLSCLTLLISGCASNSTVKRTPSPAITATFAPYPTATPPPHTVSIQRAWGVVHITRLSVDMPGNSIFTFDRAVTPDGQWLIGSIGPRDALSNTTIASEVVLYNISTHQIRRIHAVRSPQSYVLAASADGDWLVWSENTPNQDPNNWAIQSYNLRTGEFKPIAQATHVNGAFPAGNVPQPVASGGYVIWSEDVGVVTPGAPATYANSVMKWERLDTGVVTTLATSAVGGALSWPWAAWGVITSTGGYIQFKNLATGQSAQLNEQPNYIVLKGTTAIYSFIPRQIVAIPDVSHPGVSYPIFMPTTDGLEVQDPSISDRLIAWNEASGPPIPLVWDRSQRALVMLPSTSAQTYGAWTGAHVLLWDDPESAALQQADQQKNLSPLYTICVVDTRILPTTPPA